MNTQAQGELLINITVTLAAAHIVLEGLGKLPIERAGGLYAGLRDAIDGATAKAINDANAPNASRGPLVDSPPPSDPPNESTPNPDPSPTH